MRRTRARILSLAAVGWCLAWGCVPSASDSAPSRSAERPGRTRHVVIVVVDGLRPDTITADTAPFLHGRLDRCAYTLEAQTVRPSLTLPAHASLLSGLDPEEHRVLWNEYDPGRGYIGVRTIFDLAGEAGLKAALIGGKRKLIQLARPGLLDLRSSSPRRSAKVMAAALAYLSAELPDLLLLHLPDVDRAGHARGWMGERQRDAIRKTDGLLRELFEVLEGLQPRRTWAVIITADHGGHDFHHERETPEDLTIPWILCGSDVSPGKLGPLSIRDTARAGLDLLGLDAEPNP